MLHYNSTQIKSLAKSKFPFLWEKRIAIVLITAAILLFYSFRHIVEVIAVMTTFIVIGVLSMMYNRWVKVSLGFELIILGVVVTASVYGRWQGLIVGFAALFFAEMLTDRFTYSTFVSFIGVFVVAMAVPLLGTMGIAWKGVWMTVLYDAVIGPGYILLGSSPWRTLLFVATHILFNTWIFMLVAPRIVPLLA